MKILKQQRRFRALETLKLRNRNQIKIKFKVLEFRLRRRSSEKTKNVLITAKDTVPRQKLIQKRAITTK